jgi:hypothetical protein
MSADQMGPLAIAWKRFITKHFEGNYMAITEQSSLGVKKMDPLAAVIRRPAVKMFQFDNNGKFHLQTTAQTPERFLDAAGEAMAVAAMELNGDLEHAFGAMLPMICQMYCKLKGYQAPGVVEERVLYCGSVDPTDEVRWEYPAKGARVVDITPNDGLTEVDA